VKESSDDLSDKQLAQVGRVFKVTIRIQGEQGQRFGLNWFVVDDATGSRLPGRSFNQTPAVFKPRNQDQERGYPVWIPPLPPGRYRATFVLTDADGQQQDDDETAPFTVKARRS
jgi:hypothetical protein